MCSLNTNSSRFHCLSARFLSISIAIAVSLVAGTSKSDINGNCADELAVGRKSPENQRAVVWNDSFLHYTENTVFGDDWHSSIYVTAVAWGDVDGDGRDELAIARKTSYGHRVLLYRWDNNGNAQEIWTTGEEWSDAEYATDVAFGDVDGDGKMELAIAINSGAEERVSVYRFDFDSATDTYWGTVLFSTGTDWDTSFYATAVAWGDIDGDSREELAIARKSTSGQRVSVYRWDDGGDAQEIWTTGGDWSSSQYATDVAFGDMDGDGKMELAIARDAPKNYQRVSVYRWDDGGNAQQIWVTGAIWGDSSYATAVAWGDIDGDGRDELAIARKSASNQRVSVYRWDDVGNANQAWTTGGDWGDTNYATDVAFGDMDGDGKMELAIARDSNVNERFQVWKLSLMPGRNQFFSRTNGSLFKGGNQWGPSNYATSVALSRNGRMRPQCQPGQPPPFSVCNGLDNDGDGLIDNEDGACLLRVLLVPWCWGGTQEDFLFRAQEQIDFLVDAYGVNQCAEAENHPPPDIRKWWFEYADIEDLNLDCQVTCDGDCQDADYYAHRPKYSLFLQEILDSNQYKELEEFDIVMVLTDKDYAGSGKGAASGYGSPLLYIEGFNHNPSGDDNSYMISAHELGHTFNLRDEYCDVAAGGNSNMCANAVDKNTLNYLDAADGCDPTDTDGSCCHIDFRNPEHKYGTDDTPCAGSYNRCCLGNKALDLPPTTYREGDPDPTYDPTSNGRCIMSFMDAPGPRAFCRQCWNHIKEQYMMCWNNWPEDSPAGSVRRLSTLALLQNLLQPSPESDGGGGEDAAPFIKILKSDVLPSSRGDLGLIAPGEYTLKLLTSTGELLGETGIHPMAFQDAPGEVPSDIFLWLRIPIGDYPDDAPFVMRLFHNQDAISQTTINGRAPIAVAEDVVAECTSPQGALVLLNAGQSYDPDGDRIFYNWSTTATVLANENAAQTTGLFPIQSSSVQLTVTDGTDLSHSLPIAVTVVDTTPPDIEHLAPRTVYTCDAAATVLFTPPEATDLCTSNVIVEGKVVAKNNQSIDGILLFGHSATLLPGSYVIQWSATDNHGNTSHSYQDVHIRSALRATNSVVIRDRGAVLSPVFNSGSGVFELGADAQSQSVFTAGNAFLRERAAIAGDILAGGRIDTQNQVVVQGNMVPFSNPEFGPIGDDDLAAIAIPTSFDHRTVNSGSALSLAPGIYGDITVNSGATLILSEGTFFFRALTINTNAQVIVPTEALQTNIFIANHLALRARFTDTSGMIVPVQIAYQGSNAVFVESLFYGVFLAPNARLVLGQNGTYHFEGRFLAKDLEVATSASLRCELW